jgi:site-specific recombinase XerD
VPLQPEALAVAQELAARPDRPGYLACLKVWTRVRAAIGRPDCKIHDLRHSRASQLARNGASLPMIGALLGHSSPMLTARYSHLVDSDLRALVERS